MITTIEHAQSGIPNASHLAENSVSMLVRSIISTYGFLKITRHLVKIGDNRNVLTLFIYRFGRRVAEIVIADHITDAVIHWREVINNPNTDWKLSSSFFGISSSDIARSKFQRSPDLSLMEGDAYQCLHACVRRAGWEDQMVEIFGHECINRLLTLDQEKAEKQIDAFFGDNG